MDILTDTTINGYDVSIYEQEDGLLTLDIKFPCGEIIAGWCDIEKYYTAERMALAYISGLTKTFKTDTPHCDNEYCIDAFNKKEETKP